MPRAILSVSDKTGITDFGRALAELGWEIVSTGGTARALRDAGVRVLDVSEVTGHPEILGGRVKTLHPAVHAGILSRRSVQADTQVMEKMGYRGIDLVAVNLYPFHEAVAGQLPLAEAMEEVDIGGPTMLRAAAKNHEDVLVVVDHADYSRVLGALRANDITLELRRQLARKVFDHTATYDRAIAAYFDRQANGEASALPATITLQLERVQSLRYGENPDQPAAFYREQNAPADALPALEQLHGKELSFNNLLDVEAAVSAISAWHDDDDVACVIIKHTTPCGVALAAGAEEAYKNALACDPVSAFGGIVAFNHALSAATAQQMAQTFLEIVIAPDFEAEALEVLRKKKNLRLIKLPVVRSDRSELDYKRVRGGMLVQTRMLMDFPEEDWKVVSQRVPSAAELKDLRFAWRVCAAVKSNAIVLAAGQRTLGIGAGQMSRVDSSRIAVMKAQDQNAHLQGAVLASDAFFPFRDGVDAAAGAGIRAVIQPGGSVRDEEVIAAADEHDMAMIFTGRRVFRH
ncbi:MAG TPA: bifunctional phosphoribosylaminoimidazolecarboxamide formyltransferase/IMP cyclohydrolase [Longimicrobiales bacterium]|nr:bifunctional phosphoribosylaminoimidazolecarboxamide formyltransferase/IMP cyclohydrolase [Longimicrobiales bacterium]